MPTFRFDRLLIATFASAALMLGAVAETDAGRRGGTIWIPRPGGGDGFGGGDGGFHESGRSPGGGHNSPGDGFSRRGGGFEGDFRESGRGPGNRYDAPSDAFSRKGDGFGGDFHQLGRRPGNRYDVPDSGYSRSDHLPKAPMNGSIRERNPPPLESGRWRPQHEGGKSAHHDRNRSWNGDKPPHHYRNRSWNGDKPPHHNRNRSWDGGKPPHHHRKRKRHDYYDYGWDYPCYDWRRSWNSWECDRFGYYYPDYSDDEGYSSAHYRWCRKRYRSYDARTNTFMGNDGRRHRCDSPYD